MWTIPLRLWWEGVCLVSSWQSTCRQSWWTSLATPPIISARCTLRQPSRSTWRQVHFKVFPVWECWPRSDFREGDAGADDNVCECEQRAAQDELHEDGRLLARLQPLRSLCRGSSPRVYGEWNCLVVFGNNFWKDAMREDNHRDEIKRINVESIANKEVVAFESKFDKLEGNCCFFVWSSYL